MICLYPKNKKTLPFFIRGTKYLKPIKFIDDIGSAQIKTCICFAPLNSPGQTLIKSRRCRNHTEILFNHLKIPIKIIPCPGIINQSPLNLS